MLNRFTSASERLLTTDEIRHVRSEHGKVRVMTIAKVLDGKGGGVTTLSDDTILREAIDVLASHSIGAAPVIAGNAVVGVFSERDVIHGLRALGAAAFERSVAEFMTAPAVTVSRDVSVIGALAMMTERRIRHLPVVEAGELVGVVSIGDLVKYRIGLIEAEAATLRDYIQSA